MKRRIISAILATALIASMTACSSNEEAEETTAAETQAETTVETTEETEPEETAPELPELADGVLVDYDFTQGYVLDMEINPDSPAAAEVYNDGDSLVISVEDTGNVEEDILLYTNTFSIVNGQNYSLEYSAYSDVDCSIYLKIESADPDDSTWAMGSTIYLYEFSMTSTQGFNVFTDIENARISIYAGQNLDEAKFDPHDIHFEYLRLVEVNE